MWWLEERSEEALKNTAQGKNQKENMKLKDTECRITNYNIYKIVFQKDRMVRVREN